jgi:flagellar basal-body rod protein FlgB
MQLFDITQLALERAIGGAAMRHTAIAGNIANANTPGFVPKDVDFHAALATALEQRGASTEELRSDLESVSFSAAPDGTVRMRADGSGFDIDAQAAQLAGNGLEYEALVTIARGRIDIIKSAIGTR